MVFFLKSSFRIFGLVTALILLVSLFPVSNANADETMVSYPIDELAMTIDVPSSVKVVTRGIKQNAPVFSDGTFDYIETMSIVRDNSDYLLGRDLVNNYEIEVIMKTDDNDGISNLKSASEKKQDALLNSTFEKEGTIACTVYKNKDNVYIETVSKGFVNGMLCYSKEYRTIMDEQSIVVKLSSYGDQLSDSETALLKSIVDGIEFEQSDNFAVLSSLKPSVVIPFAMIVISFAVLLVIKIRNLLYPEDEENKVDEENEVQPLISDEEGDRFILDMLSTDDELEQKSREQNKQEEKTESEILTGEYDSDEDEENGDASENDTKIVSGNDMTRVVNDISEENSESIVEGISGEDSESVVEGVCKENSSNGAEVTNSSIVAEDVTGGSANGEFFAEKSEENLDDDNYDDVDIAAAIALFEDNFETRKARREQYKEKNKKKSRFGVFK